MLGAVVERHELAKSLEPRPVGGEHGPSERDVLVQLDRVHSPREISQLKRQYERIGIGDGGG